MEQLKHWKNLHKITKDGPNGKRQYALNFYIIAYNRVDQLLPLFS